jgi:hypothetical protein
VFGRRLKTNARGSCLFGYSAELSEYEGNPSTDSSGIYNKGAIGVGAGLPPSEGALKQFGGLFTKYTWTKNPLYPWAGTDAQKNASAEDKFILTPDYLWRMLGDLKITGNLFINNGNKVKSHCSNVIVDPLNPVLDFLEGDCFKLTPSEDPTVPQLLNWSDGSIARLIVYNGGTLIALDASWIHMNIIPDLQTDGKDVFEIQQVDDDIIIEHKFSIDGSGVLVATATGFVERVFVTNTDQDIEVTDATHGLVRRNAAGTRVRSRIVVDGGIPQDEYDVLPPES